jgi:SusD family.
MKYFFFILSACLLCACGESFLDTRPSVRQRVPESLADYIALLDNTGTMSVSSHALGMIGGDELYLTEPSYNTFPTGVNYNYQKRAYTWEKQIFEGGETYKLDWNDGYKRILWANLVLDGIGSLSLSAGDKAIAEQAKGMALFHRAWNYYNLAQLFCPVYEQSAASTSVGLPLRLEPDLTIRIGRSNLDETYRQIIADLEAAKDVLPIETVTIFRPNKAAALALLSRIYLQMGNYQQANEYADQCLALSNELLDYNTVDVNMPLSFTPLAAGNPEVLFLATLSGQMTGYLRILTTPFILVDIDLYHSYEVGDIRREAYFLESSDGNFGYKGSYDATSYSYFTGMATDEVYLTKAECAVRLGDIPTALAAVNNLRKHRFLPDTFVAWDIQDADELLDSILAERRRELVFRGTRWEDLRRLNKEPRYAKTLTRVVGDRTFTLEPGSSRYIWPIPLEAIQVGGYEQNER